MVRFFRVNFSDDPRRRTAALLAFFWCFGLVTGAAFAASAHISSFPLMRTALMSCVSISGAVAVLLLPLLFSAFAVYISKIRLLIPIAFLKAFFFSYLGTAVMRSFPSSGWMLRFLLLFSDCLAAPLLILLWLRLSRSSPRTCAVSIPAAAIALSLIGCLDFYIVSPFLVSLTS